MPEDLLLIVDDEEANRDMLGRRLKRSGYRVVLAEDGPAALQVLETEPVALVLLDIMMPGMSGIEVLRRIRATRDPLRLPVIMVSANTDSPQIVEALNLGANDYVVKPVDFPVCLARVETQLAQRPQAQDFEPDVGREIGPYRLERLLGRGSAAAVYEALDRRLERRVALKILSREMAARPDTLARFQREARAAAAVTHRGVAQVYEVGSDPCQYIAMELVHGVRLDVHLEGKPLGPQGAARLAADIAMALAALHARGVVHRDLKPSNIMVDPREGIRLVDFGVARIAQEDVRLTRTGEVLGTPIYAAPEQFDPSFGEVGPAADQFALGGLLYEMLCGHPPVRSRELGPLIQEIVGGAPESPRAANPAVPDDLDAVVRRARARRPEDRFPDVGAMAQALDRVAGRP